MNGTKISPNEVALTCSIGLLLTVTGNMRHMCVCMDMNAKNRSKCWLPVLTMYRNYNSEMKKVFSSSLYECVHFENETGNT